MSNRNEEFDPGEPRRQELKPQSRHVTGAGETSEEVEPHFGADGGDHADIKRYPHTNTNTDGAEQTDFDTNVNQPRPGSTSVGGREAGGTVGSGGVATTDVGPH